MNERLAMNEVIGHQSQTTHWPIDPELEEQILRIERKANDYLDHSRETYTEGKEEKQEHISNFSNDHEEHERGTEEIESVGTDQLVYQEEQEDHDDDGEEESIESQVSSQKNILQVEEEVKMPRGRVNRRVFDLKPGRKEH